jgi:hypothetical protein
MLTEDHVAQFELFGFVILRNIFTDAELKTLREEFNHAATRHGKEVGSFDGENLHNFSMLGEDTPFYSSLLEDPRFYGPAAQLFGDDIFGLEVNSYRYVGNTSWHFNDGSPNIYGYGPKYQFPVFGPVTAETGALRVIPGSHKDPWQSELTRWWPLARASASKERAREYLDKVPCYVTECDPGDAVLFDMRIVHGTFGGSVDRKVSAVTYYHYPKTPEELEVMRVTARSFYKNPKRWNKTQWDEWFSNLHESPLRQRWIDSWERLAKTEQSETGLQLVYDDSGGATFSSMQA